MITFLIYQETEERSYIQKEIYVDEMSSGTKRAVRIFPSNEALYNRVERTSIMFYTINEDGELYFMFGIDSKTKDITDPGGGVKKDETMVSGGIREVNEELRGMMQEYATPNYITRFISAADKFMGTMFVPIPNNWIADANREFRKRETVCANKSYHELYSIHWMTYRELKRQLMNRKSRMWSRIRRFYSLVIDDEFIKLLETFHNYEYRMDCNNSS